MAGTAKDIDFNQSLMSGRLEMPGRIFGFLLPGALGILKKHFAGGIDQQKPFGQFVDHVSGLFFEASIAEHVSLFPDATNSSF